MSSIKTLLIGALGIAAIATATTTADAAVIMDQENHNGSFIYVDDSYIGDGADGIFDAGFWDVNNPPPAGRVPVPTGWEFTGWYSVYHFLAGIQLRAALGGEDVYVWNNTGELAQANMQYTVTANLGGQTGARATVSVLATENADGTGNIVPLATVFRDANDLDGYSLFEVSATGPGTTSAIDGYFIQVLVNTGLTTPDVVGDPNGYYGNIRVSVEEAVPEPATLGMVLVSGAFLAARRRRS